ncbi:MAG: helix-turn-helix domain-containing protein [Clostridiales bacterium]|nr:helix-turn-helix domain-containing protein [Clostridiales bacterium]
MTVGKRIRSMRHNANMTLKELSAEIRVSLNTIYRWEHEIAVPRKEALRRIAEVFQVPLKWLLYGVTVEEGNAALRPDEIFEQNLLRICRKLSDTSKYKILGYAERVWVEEMKEDTITALRY